MRKNISVDEAVDEILKSTRLLSCEKVFLYDAVNRVIAEDIVSSVNIPPLNNSAMDGYALKYEDTLTASKANPAKIKIVGEAPAGKIFDREIKKGETVKIMTGGVIPLGADAVLRREDVEEHERFIKIFSPVKKGQDIREKGEDIKENDIIVKRGFAVSSACVGVLASIGRSFVNVYRKPVVTVIVTGDEIADIDEPFSKGKIKNSNGFTLTSLLKAAGCFVRQTAIVKDNETALISAIEANKNSDVILSTGGVSMGDYDFVKDVVSNQGFEPVFWKVRVKPGRPLFFARGDSCLYFGIPGNPVSVMTTFYNFVLPAIRKMQGFENVFFRETYAVLKESIKRKENRSEFIRGILEEANGELYVSATGPQGSGILTSMLAANCFIVFDEGRPLSEKGEKVRVRVFDPNFYFV
jgi:molybdopterin molybdotransferase